MKPGKVPAGAAEPKFRRNVLCVGAAHLVVIGGLVGGAAWLESRATAPEPIQWLDPASFGGGAAAVSVEEKVPVIALAHTPEVSREEANMPATPPEVPVVAPESPVPPRTDEFSTVKPTPTPKPKPTPIPPAVAKSSPPPKTIRKPVSSPSPTPRNTKKVSPSPTPKPKPRPKPIPGSSAVPVKNEAKPKRTAPPPPSPTPGRNPAAATSALAKVDGPEELAARKAAIADAINSAGDTSRSSTSGGAGKNGGGGNTATILGVYNDMIHDRFYSEWDQPTVAGGVPAGTMGVLLKVRVEKDGTISQSSLSSASGVPAMDNSVRAVPAKVGKIEPPPLEILGKRSFYEVSIKFDRN